MTPERFQREQAVAVGLGDQADRLEPWLHRQDALADAVVDAFAGLGPGQGFRMLNEALARGIGAVPDPPEALVALFQQLDAVPSWVDGRALGSGGALLFRAGFLGGLVLGLGSLVSGYCAPGGNKPLILSGRLQAMAPQRLNETARFVHATCTPGGLRRYGEGFAITVRVRVMHAQVRRMIRRGGKWREDLWGAPINQHDMAATTLLFSSVFVNGLRTLGLTVSPDEAAAFLQLWRYGGYLMGVDPELLCGSEAEAARLTAVIAATQGPPDDDARALTDALLSLPMQLARTDAQRRRALERRRFSQAVCRALLGDALADGLHLPRSPWRLAVPALRGLLGPAERLRTGLPLGSLLATRAGRRYWDWIIAHPLAGADLSYAPPTRLAG
jgi:hypothetical protein